MQPHPDLIELIDRASLIAKSDYKLAHLIGVSPQTMSNWRHGEKPCHPADVALIAETLGLDPQEWLARATLWKYEGTKKGDKLQKALGKTSVAITGVLASSGAVAATISNAIPSVNVSEWLIWASTMYRKVKFFTPESITQSAGIADESLLYRS